MSDQKIYNNLALCYHGIVLTPEEKHPYRSYINDFKGQIKYLKGLGYSFVKPTQYYEWYIGQYIPTTPIATIIFDDGLDSVNLITPWLIDMQIPFGIAVIVSRQKSYTPEQDYMSWSSLKALTESNLCEILSHSYNLHHTNLQVNNAQILPAPIMEAPNYLDNGEFLYIAKDDKRYYWDFSHVQNISWAFPLMGTDTKTKVPIQSTIKFTASKDLTVSQMRFWACLHQPYSTGYTANVKIYIDNTLVSTFKLKPTQYGNITQWPEREFVTIALKTPFKINSGKVYTIKFVTQNIGNSTFRIYSVPNFTGDSELTSTCTGETFAQSEIWTAKACMILTDGKGITASDAIYSSYIYDDLLQGNLNVSKYLNATWTAYTTGYTEVDPLETVVIGGTYSNGLLADTKVNFHATNTFLGELLRIKYTSIIGERYPLVVYVYINNIKVGEFEPSWQNWSWQEIQIYPFSFQANMDYTIRFETKNASSKLGLVRIYLDQVSPPQLLWNNTSNTWEYPGTEVFAHKTEFEVTNIEGTDLAPDDVVISGNNYTWIYRKPYDGPGKAFMEIMSRKNGSFIPPNHIVYPFGSYYSSGTTKEDLHPSLITPLNNVGISSGFSVWDEPLEDYVNIQTKYSKYVIPRYLVPGDLEQTVILNNFNTLIGK